MKNKMTKKLALSKSTITKLEQLHQLKIKGGTLPGSPPGEFSAHESQCGHLRCY